MQPTETLIAGSAPPEPPPSISPSRPRYLDPFSAFFLSILALVLPRTAGRGFLRVPLWTAALIAALNLAILSPGIIYLAGGVEDQLVYLFLYPRTFMFLALLSGLSMFFFVAMPFVPRPGANGAVVRHLSRVLFLSTTWLYLWVGAYVLLYQILFKDNYRLPVYSNDAIILILGTAGLLILHNIWAFIRSASHEYRVPADFPAPRDPRCEQCGYELRGTDPAGRCSECGKPVTESLSPTSRSPSPWELNPSFFNFSLILRQMFTLVRRPQALFRTVPLLTHHRAAHRWLTLMIILVGFMSFWIVLGIRLDFWIAYKINPATGIEAANLTFTDWQFYAAGIAVAAIWVFLGLMMVGIETAGIATIAYFRQRPVDLAAASKVTCYASTLLLFWVFIGSMQVIPIALYGITDAAHYVSTHWGPRWDSLITVGSVGIAQIGGLLWFEFTVYRGLWAIQYANH